MTDFAQLLTERSETITNQWIEAVSSDRQIQSTENLSRTAIRDHIPHVLKALATVLSHKQDSDIATIAQASLQHGTLRAEQGFDPAEITREYHLLRSTILSTLRTDLLQGTPEELFRAMSLINAVVDTAIAQCFKSYMQERLRELEQLQNQLTLTNQELNRLIRASQENLAMLAHELKTPLNSIIGYSDLFLRQQRQSEMRDTVASLEHIERVLRNGRKLLRLINDVLELSRCDAGRMTLQLAETDVDAIIASVLETVHPLADSRGLELVMDCNLAPKQVTVDSLRLQQILTNLVSNAIRYTVTGSVTIYARSIGSSEWEVSVTDTGIGIPPDDQTRIFDPFVQLRSSESLVASDGTGLGLAIVARLVNLMQGRISLTSQVGIGTTVTVVLPIEVRQPEDATASTV
ncbi:sensor histidine kinase [Thermocoleostomius sinensis]|jgi:signal transduction histidine kinase|uniref:Circadian input-output histidine kinase CikA n=1 Tax=Thermocoleostomius sinensis A174 TaxID=2016057 RepID=A0A9E8ZIE9_9CYAN|nr:sensor histidine kinase [Thermocoleostomius sinensis]WAL62277.1 sensor histidine kinase [Thermocoleostomius sinensis A174]